MQWGKAVIKSIAADDSKKSHAEYESTDYM
jgi:hypothetical protein